MRWRRANSAICGALLDHQRIGKGDDRVHAFSRQHIEGGVEVSRTARLTVAHVQAEPAAPLAARPAAPVVHPHEPGWPGCRCAATAAPVSLRYSSRLPTSSRLCIAMPVARAAGAREAGDQPRFDRVAAETEDHRHRAVAHRTAPSTIAPCATITSAPPRKASCVSAAAVVALAPAHIEHEVAALDPAALAQALAQGLQVGRRWQCTGCAADPGDARSARHGALRCRGAHAEDQACRGTEQAAAQNGGALHAAPCTTRDTAIGRASPLSWNSPAGSTARPLPSSAAATRGATRISPPLASPHSRAARLVTLPMAP